MEHNRSYNKQPVWFDEKFQVQSVEKSWRLNEMRPVWASIGNDNSQMILTIDVLPGHYPSATPDTADRVKKDNAGARKGAAEGEDETREKNDGERRGGNESRWY